MKPATAATLASQPDHLRPVAGYARFPESPTFSPLHYVERARRGATTVYVAACKTSRISVDMVRAAPPRTPMSVCLGCLVELAKTSRAKARSAAA